MRCHTHTNEFRTLMVGLLGSSPKTEKVYEAFREYLKDFKTINFLDLIVRIGYTNGKFDKPQVKKGAYQIAKEKADAISMKEEQRQGCSMFGQQKVAGGGNL